MEQSGTRRPPHSSGTHWGINTRGPYTGVVVIHGIGDEKRNDTLQEALNALSYWFNHKAKLALKETGKGRIWVRTQLTLNDDPDAESSSAVVELEAPESAGGGASAPLYLQLREVWWARTFGKPDVNATLKWARVQWDEQRTHILLPPRVRSGAMRASQESPARETPQALTYSPPHTRQAGGSRGKPRLGQRAERFAMYSLLAFYDVVQYFWKLVGWVLLAPVLAVVLVLISLLRLLALIPFLRTAVLSSIQEVTTYLALHWIGSIQIYLFDYTRSSAVRQKFNHDLQEFLNDDLCERVVVIAHSFGTVISYESLSTMLTRPGHEKANSKPITYICLADALRRVWLLAANDPERLRGVLPPNVRWLHFWARYDPVSVGPLSSRSLTPLDARLNLARTGQYADLYECLDRCENVDVINTDSTLKDHTTYWENMEQVVGPIALELVAGHPALERHVRAHLATPEDIMRRRWQVGWRWLLAILGSIGAAALLIILDITNNGAVANGIVDFVRGVVQSSLIQGLLASIIPGYSQLTAQGQNVGHLVATSPWLVLPYLVALYDRYVIIGLTALLILWLGVPLIRKILAMPPAMVIEDPRMHPAIRRRVFGWALTTTALCCLGMLAASIDPTSFGIVHAQASIVVVFAWVCVGLWEFAAIITMVTALWTAIRNWQVGWVLGLPLAIWAVLTTLTSTGSTTSQQAVAHLYALAFLSIAIVGCLVALYAFARLRQWSTSLNLLIALLLEGSLLAHVLWQRSLTFYDNSSFPFAVAGTPLLIYGLTWLLARTVGASAQSSLRTVVLMGAVVAMVFSVDMVNFAGLVVISVVLTVISVVSAARARLWGWLAAIPAITAVMFVLYSVLGQSIPGFTFDVSVGTALSLLVSSCCYAFWSNAAVAPNATAPSTPELVPILIGADMNTPLD